jgi:hypothetical protein
LPRAAVSGVVFALPKRVDDREKLVAGVRGGEPSPSASLKGRGTSGGDFVLLANGDRATGTLKELANRIAVLEIAGQLAKLPLGRVEAIGFAGGRPSAGEPSPGPSLKGRGNLIVGLRDGSVVYAKNVRASETDLEIELVNGAKLKSATADIAALESLGEQVFFLSDLEGANYRHVPYLSLKWPYTRDRNVLGATIIVDGTRYWKGIGMHSASRLTYTLDRNYRRFDSAVAIDDSANGRGSVVFGVYVSRDGKWVDSFTSGTVRGGEKPVPISVDLRGVKGLTLTVDFADRGDELDRAVWLDARLVK